MHSAACWTPCGRWAAVLIALECDMQHVAQHVHLVCLRALLLGFNGRAG